MIGIWGVLDIEPTSDASIIKKAYAKKLKIYHPEDDPAGYQRLREAYDQALKYMKQAAAVGNGSDSPHPQPQSARSDGDEKVSVIVKEHPVEAFLERVEELYKDFSARIQLKRWEELLGSDVLWDIEYATTIRDEMINFFCRHYYLPQPIWRAIDTIFRFKEQQEELAEEYGEETVLFLIDRINGLREMRYDIFTGDEEIDFDGYFQLREDIQHLLTINDLQNMKIELRRALTIFYRDLDVLYMQAVYHTRIGEQESALQTYERMLSIEPGNVDAQLARAEIYYNNDQYEKAVQTLECLLTKETQQAEAIILMMKCRAHLEEWDLYKREIDNLLKIKGMDYGLFTYVYEAYNKSGHTAAQPKKQEEKPLLQFFLRVVMITVQASLRTWLYIIVGILIVMTSLPSVYATILLLPFLWEAARLYKVYIRG